MRISCETALLWSAVSQGLKTPGQMSSRGGAGPGHPGPAIPPDPGHHPSQSPVTPLYPTTGQPNHVPFLSLSARQADLLPEAFLADQQGTRPGAVRIMGPSTGPLLAPLERVPALAQLAAVTGKEQAADRIAALSEEEVRAAVAWIQRRLQESGKNGNGGKTYPELRQGAPDSLLRPVERGIDRALHQETALQQVLQALEHRGAVVSTLGGLNTSEGPYRYHLRTRMAAGAPPAEDALTTIAAWYAGSFAPIGIRDLAAWSGLPERVCRRSLARAPFPLRTVTISGLPEEDFLVPEGVMESTGSDETICTILPWADQWLHAYRNMDRFAPRGLPMTPTPRDLVLISLGTGIPADQCLAVHVRVVGSAREPRLQPEPWRPLAAHETAALEVSLDSLERSFRPG